MKKGWEYKELGELCHKINGLWKGKKEPFVKVGVIRNANFTKAFTLDFSNVEYLDVEEKQYASRKLQPGDLIVEKSGGSEKQPVGRTVLFMEKEGEFSFSNFTSLLRIKDREEITPEFLYNHLLYVYFRGDTKKMQKATTGIHNLDFDKFLNIKISIPPLSEQKEIVEYLDSSFAKIDTLKANAAKNLEEAKALFQSALKDALEPKEGCSYDKLVNVYNFIDYRGATPTKISEGVPLVTAKNVKYGYLDYTIKDFISEDEYAQRQSRGISHKGDLLFTTEAPLGNVAIADLDRFSAGQRLITFQKYSKSKYEVENKFYFFYMLSPVFQAKIKSLATGATAQGIKAKILKEIIVPIPSLPEQQSIVSFLDSLNEKVNTLQQNYSRICDECDALKQAILRQVFE